MAKEYLEKLSVLMDKVTAGRFEDVPLTCKHFFGGAAFYANEKICITFTPVGLAMKLPEPTVTKLLKNKKAMPLKYFPKAPIKKGYVLFPQGIEKNGRTMYTHARRSIEYVLSTP